MCQMMMLIESTAREFDRMAKESLASNGAVEHLRDEQVASREAHEKLTQARDEAQKEAQAWAAKLSTDIEAEREKIKATVEKACQERYEAQAAATQAEMAEVERGLR
ncbi:unnamed protein product [Linum trigynum]|uniref:Uncharacterized protein n=1 Tax=Linum trigynum TaxID=586398 RepID=A0AAV2CCR1_9ROSI